MHGWWAISYGVLWLLVIVLALLLVALARQVGTLHLRLGPRGALEMDDEGPTLGEAPPAHRTLDSEGDLVSIGGPGDPQLLLFVSPSCPICADVLPSVPVIARDGRLTPLVIVDDESVGDLPARAGGTVVAGPEVAAAFSIPGTPYVVVTDGAGIVRAKGTVNNLEQMEGLLDTANRRISEADQERAAG